MGLIVTYMYIGKLMSFLVFEDTAKLPVTDIHEFAARRYHLCVSRNFAMQRLARQFYKGDIIALPKAELPEAVATGRCQGILERTRIAYVMLAGGQPQILP